MNTAKTPEKYDGFATVPDRELHESKIVFFNLDEESKEGIPIENSSLGDKYHVALFKYNATSFDFDESFEAIFIDPLVYAERLLPNFYGMFVRKTDKSLKWFEEYLTDLLRRSMIEKLRNQKKILESCSTD